MTFDEQLRRAVDTLTVRLRDEITQHVHVAATEIGALTRADREQGAADARDASDRLVDAFRALDDARSITGILDTLAARAAQETERAAILLVRGERIREWRFVGFDASFEGDGTIDIPLEECGIIGESVTTNAVAAADSAHPVPFPSFAAASPARDAVCAPIALAGDVVAVVYADCGAAGASVAWRHRIEMLARHATRCLEAVIAFKAARMLTDASPDPASQDESDGSAEDESAARRYARLLVSEIRLYHEDAVAAGRRERDLATRLGGEIARARMLYEQRVATHLRRRADYFQDELVRTLADGDPALLELRT